MKRNLTKRERIKKKRDFERVFTSAKRITCRGAKLLFMKNEYEKSRIAVTLPRKYGNAVKRNRTKRIVREIYRNEKPDLLGGYDIIMIMYPGKDDFQSRKKQIQYLFSKAGLYRN